MQNNWKKIQNLGTQSPTSIKMLAMVAYEVKAAKISTIYSTVSRKRANKRKAPKLTCFLKRKLSISIWENWVKR